MNRRSGSCVRAWPHLLGPDNRGGARNLIAHAAGARRRPPGRRRVQPCRAGPVGTGGPGLGTSVATQGSPRGHARRRSRPRSRSWRGPQEGPPSNWRLSYPSGTSRPAAGFGAKGRFLGHRTKPRQQSAGQGGLRQAPQRPQHHPAGVTARRHGPVNAAYAATAQNPGAAPGGLRRAPIRQAVPSRSHGGERSTVPPMMHAPACPLSNQARRPGRRVGTGAGLPPGPGPGSPWARSGSGSSA